MPELCYPSAPGRRRPGRGEAESRVRSSDRRTSGEVPERPNGLDSKSSDPLRDPWVRIPPSPPICEKTPPICEKTGSLKPVFLFQMPRLSGFPADSSVPGHFCSIPTGASSGSLYGRFSLRRAFGSIPIKCRCYACVIYENQQVIGFGLDWFDCQFRRHKVYLENCGAY